jgi:hypothetical protein
MPPTSEEVRSYGLWANLRADPVLRPVAEPKPRAKSGDWVTDLGIRGWPLAPEGWRLRQMLGEDSLALVYLHRSTARGATVVLAHKPNANGPGKPAWRFSWGMTWSMCADLDCEFDQLHTADLPKTTGAKEIKALLTEGT